MSKVLVIGAGGVGSVAVHKMAMNPDIFPRHHAGEPPQVQVRRDRRNR